MIVIVVPCQGTSLLMLVTKQPCALQAGQALDEITRAPCNAIEPLRISCCNTENVCCSDVLADDPSMALTGFDDLTNLTIFASHPFDMDSLR